MEKQNQSGRIEIDGKHIVYSLGKKECWRIPAIRICAIGEYTTAAGPYMDDYFLVFVVEGGKWHEASFYSKGRDTFLSELSKLFNEHLHPGLTQSTKWNSRVLWPKELEGKELFVVGKGGTDSLLGKLKQKISSPGDFKLAPAVLKLASQHSH